MGSTTTYSGGMLITNYDNSKIFIMSNTWLTGSYNNDTYDPIDLPIGTLMGRIATSGLLVPLESAATDGSQYPVGVLATNYTVADGDTVNVTICTGGEVSETGIVFQGSDDFDTVVSDRTLRDRIAADTVGIVLRLISENSIYDNQ